MPRLTIGMPLYNNARTLRRAINALQSQTFGDFVVLLSDDGSRDESVAIAEEAAQLDARFSVVRQPRNLNYGNFRYLLQEARTELFMFAAGDDWWLPTFIERCVQVLDSDPAAVGAVSKVTFVDERGEVAAMGTEPLLGSVVENLDTYLRSPGDNSRMYGVFRTEPARRAFPATDHHAFDWTFSAATLLFGTHREVPEMLMYREATPTHKYTEYVRRDAHSRLDRLLPLRAMTSSLVREKRMPLNARTLRALAVANIHAHIGYMRKHHPLYWRLCGFGLERLVWRL
jgi:glycosyltransferase involved in cell wall biosynthesis